LSSLASAPKSKKQKKEEIKGSKDEAKGDKGGKVEVKEKKAPKPKNKAPKGPNPLSVELAAICGTDRLNAFQVTKQVWVYIKEHNLQNPSNKREILCDEALEKVMKRKK
jgi:upstream activation factor subunit UAF30